jgi:hypothetical protein
VPQGGCNCGDYGYRNGWWNNQTFKQPNGSAVHCESPADVFAHFHGPPLNMKFGGIRKPRTYSNKNLCHKNGWLLPDASDVGEGGDINFNFSVPAMSAWYTSTHAHFVKDGKWLTWHSTCTFCQSHVLPPPTLCLTATSLMLRSGMDFW